MIDRSGRPVDHHETGLVSFRRRMLRDQSGRQLILEFLQIHDSNSLNRLVSESV